MIQTIVWLILLIIFVTRFVPAMKQKRDRSHKEMRDQRRQADVSIPSAGGGMKTAPARTVVSGKKPSVPPLEPDADSTTAYLRQKAMEDEKAHAEEERLEELRLHHETGGRMPAMRHYDGDGVPSGMVLVRCRYCGAENLIRIGSRRQDFTCYFCREIL